jgi:hypothetical protein
MTSSPGDPTPTVVDSRNNDVDVNASPDSAAPKRPNGTKKAKEALRRGDAYIEASDYFWARKKEADAEKERKKDERFNQAYELEKERLAVEQTRAANMAKDLEIKENEMLRGREDYDNGYYFNGRQFAAILQGPTNRDYCSSCIKIALSMGNFLTLHMR